jgi:hypothetical protein
MDAFIAGSSSRQDDGSVRRMRLLKISPKGIRDRSLLKVSSDGRRFILHGHRSSDLTGIYQGRSINEQWIRGFIMQNQFRAKTMISEHASEVAATPAKTEPVAVSPEERRKRQAERHTVNCSCLGEVEDCIRCFGKGFYTADGLGNPV